MTHSWVIARPTVGHQDVPVVLASGFVATLGITTIVYLLSLVGLPQVDLPLSVARLFVTDPVGAGALGMLVHLLVGFSSRGCSRRRSSRGSWLAQALPGCCSALSCGSLSRQWPFRGLAPWRLRSAGPPRRPASCRRISGGKPRQPV